MNPPDDDETMTRLLAAIHHEEHTMTEPITPAATVWPVITPVTAPTEPNKESGAMIALWSLAGIGIFFGGIMALTAAAILPVIFGCALILVGAFHSAVALGVLAFKQK